MATEAQTQRFSTTAGEHQKQILDLLRSVGRTRGLSSVFADWIEICAIALARMDQAQFEAREARYLQIIKQYDQSEVENFIKALGCLTLAYEECFAAGEVAFSDILGSLYMTLDMGNGDTGQFFTPYEVSRLMAMIQIEGAGDLINKKGYVQIMEPAAGAGGMLIAVAQTLYEGGFNYQRTMHATAIDIDARCVHMCFVQLSMLHIPAVVMHGNALSGKTWGQWFTPAHIMGAWQVELANRKHDMSIDQPGTEGGHHQDKTERGQIALF